MITTEEEAQTKRCQESYPAATASHNDIPTYTMAPINCIGSGCMAWRWVRENMYVPVLPSEPGGADFILHEQAGDYSTARGYCGKAGKP